MLATSAVENRFQREENNGGIAVLSWSENGQISPFVWD
jgi:hypothetical protein